MMDETRIRSHSSSFASSSSSSAASDVTVSSAPSTTLFSGQDPSHVLLQLDKGLRSVGNVAAQIGSVVQFSSLLHEYPLPVIINTSALKLADLFRRDGTSNFLRWWIYTVFKESQNHLQNVLNKNELVKRISGVLASNDPIARAITLRMLTTMSDIIHERIDLHHKIQQRLLDSEVDIFEREAAIDAVERMCSVNPQFAQNALPAIHNLILKLETPLSVKVKLIRILKHMHYDTETVQKTYRICLDLLKMYPATEFTMAITSTMTHLALNAPLVTMIRDQLELLFTLAQRDPRKLIKLHALAELARLSKKSSVLAVLSSGSDNMFSLEAINNLLDNSPHESIKLSILNLLKTHSFSSLLVQQWISQRPELISLCETFLYHPNPVFVDKSLTIAINVACSAGPSYSNNNNNNNGLSLPERVVNAICISLKRRATLLQQQSDSTTTTKVAYGVNNNKPFCICILRLVKELPHLGTRITEAIIAILQQLQPSLASSAPAQGFCRVLTQCIYNYSAFAPEAILPNAQSMLQYMSSLVLDSNNTGADGTADITMFTAGGSVDEASTAASHNNNSSDAVAPIVYQLASAILRSSQTKNNQPSSNQNLLNDFGGLLAALEEKQMHWVMYKIAQECLRHGFHAMAHHLLERIQEKIETETFMFWLSTLSHLSEAETSIQQLAELSLATSCTTTITTSSSRRVTAKGGAPLLHARRSILHCTQEIDRAFMSLKSCMKSSSSLEEQQQYGGGGEGVALSSDPQQQQPVLTFQCSVLSLRKKFLQHVHHCLMLLNEISTSHLDQASSDVFADCANAFQQLAVEYEQFRYSFFDIDEESLQVLHTQQLQCEVIVNSLRRLLVVAAPTSTSSSSSGSTGGGGGFSEPIMHSYQQQQQEQKHAAFKPLYDTCVGIIERQRMHSQQQQQLFERIKEMRNQVLYTLLRVPFALPKYFFKTMPDTIVRLEVSGATGDTPATATAGTTSIATAASKPASAGGIGTGGTMTATMGVALVLQLEGYILDLSASRSSEEQDIQQKQQQQQYDQQRQQKATKKRRPNQRIPKSVSIHIAYEKEETTTTTTRQQQGAEEQQQQQQQQRFEQVVVCKLVQSAFVSQCMCHFPFEGNYLMTITTSLVDQRGASWRASGSTSCKTIRVVVKPEKVISRLVI